MPVLISLCLFGHFLPTIAISCINNIELIMKTVQIYFICAVKLFKVLKYCITLKPQVISKSELGEWNFLSFCYFSFICSSKGDLERIKVGKTCCKGTCLKSNTHLYPRTPLGLTFNQRSKDSFTRWFSFCIVGAARSCSFEAWVKIQGQK